MLRNPVPGTDQDDELFGRDDKDDLIDALPATTASTPAAATT